MGDKFQRAAVPMMVIYFLFCLLVLFSELSEHLIPASQLTLYVTTKLLFILPALPLAYWLKKDFKSPAANAWIGILFMGYTLQGAWFRSLYALAFFELATAYSFMFAVPKRTFRLIVGSSAAILMAMLYIRWPFYAVQLEHPKRSDFILGVFAFLIISWVSNSLFSFERDYREKAMEKFGQIGLQTARMVHDLKGWISGPRVYLQLLEEQIGNTPANRNSIEALRMLTRDFDNLKGVLQEMNKLSVPSNLSGKELQTFELDELVASLRIILRKQLAGIELEHPPVRFYSDRDLLRTLLMNLALNSVQAFKTDENRRIWIEAQGSILVFRDNAGGFPPEILEALGKSQFKSTKQGGSGLGLFIVWDNMNKLGGQARAYNTDVGGCVELKFPKRAIVS